MRRQKRLDNAIPGFVRWRKTMTQFAIGVKAPNTSMVKVIIGAETLEAAILEGRVRYSECSVDEYTPQKADPWGSARREICAPITAAIDREAASGGQWSWGQCGKCLCPASTVETSSGWRTTWGCRCAEAQTYIVRRDIEPDVRRKAEEFGAKV